MSEYIERGAATQAAVEYYWKGLPFSSNGLAKAINNVPAADVKPVIRSKWEITDVDHGNGHKCFHCPECGEDEWRYDEPNYCPNCGADMRGE